MKLNVTGWVVALLVGVFALTSVNAEAATPSNTQASLLIKRLQAQSKKSIKLRIQLDGIKFI